MHTPAPMRKLALAILVFDSATIVPEAAHAGGCVTDDQADVCVTRDIYFMPGVHLHTVEAATVHCHDRALHINQIILAQALSFPNKDCAIFGRIPQSQPCS